MEFQYWILIDVLLRSIVCLINTKVVPLLLSCLASKMSCVTSSPLVLYRSLLVSWLNLQPHICGLGYYWVLDHQVVWEVIELPPSFEELFFWSTKLRWWLCCVDLVILYLVNLLGQISSCRKQCDMQVHSNFQFWVLPWFRLSGFWYVSILKPGHWCSAE